MSGREARRTVLRQLDEATLVMLSSAGEKDAYEEIVRRRQADLRRMLYRLCADRALADDLAQDAFVKGWRNLSRLHSHAHFGAWLRQIAVNTWVDRVRGAKLRTEPLHSDEALAVTSGGGPSWSEARMDVHAALARLSPAERSCIILSYWEGMSHPEIAAMTRMAVGTVKSHLFRAGPKLRQQLKAWRYVDD